MKIYWLLFFQLLNFRYHCFGAVRPLILPIISDAKNVTHRDYVILSSQISITKNIVNSDLYFKQTSYTFAKFLISPWKLSIHINDNFYFDKQAKLLVVLCHLEYVVDKLHFEYVGKYSKCSVQLLLDSKKNVSTKSCELLIGRSPSLCSVKYNLSYVNYLNGSLSFGKVVAKLVMNNNTLTESLNSRSIIFNGARPVLWKLVQTENMFKNLFIGLPVKSVTKKEAIVLPLSVGSVKDIQIFHITIEFGKCLMLNSLKLEDSDVWSMKHQFEHHYGNEIGYIRLYRNKIWDDEDLYNRIELINFTLLIRDEAKQTECSVKAVVNSVTLFSGRKKIFVKKNDFYMDNGYHKIPFDHLEMDVVNYVEPVTTNEVLTETGSRLSSRVISYLAGFDLIQELQKIRCTKKIESKQPICSKSSRQTNSIKPVLWRDKLAWALPVIIRNWCDIVPSIYKSWHPVAWNLALSDSELNPISRWRVSYGEAGCGALYQRSQLRIGVKLVQINSAGLETYLGATNKVEAPWIDISHKIKLSQLRVEPKDSLGFTRASDGGFLLSVNSTSPVTTITLSNDALSTSEILVQRRVNVLINHWTEVTGILLECISQHYQVQRMSEHWLSEGDYTNVQLHNIFPFTSSDSKSSSSSSSSSNNNNICRIKIGINFDDGSMLNVASLHRNDYRVELMSATNSYKVTKINEAVWLELTHGDQFDISQYSWPLKARLLDGCGGRTVWSGQPLTTWLTKNTTTSTIPYFGQLGGKWNNFSVTTVGDNKGEQKGPMTPQARIGLYAVIGAVGAALLILALNILLGVFIRRRRKNHRRRNNINQHNCRYNNNEEEESENKQRLTDVDKSTTPFVVGFGQQHYQQKQQFQQSKHPPLLPPPGPPLPSSTSSTTSSGIVADYAQLPYVNAQYQSPPAQPPSQLQCHYPARTLSPTPASISTASPTPSAVDAPSYPSQFDAYFSSLKRSSINSAPSVSNNSKAPSLQLNSVSNYFPNHSNSTNQSNLSHNGDVF